MPMGSRSAALLLALSAPGGAAVKCAGDCDPASLDRLWKGRRSRWRRLFEPPQLFVANPAEPHDFPLGRWNLYIGGAGARVDGYVNIDLFALPGVDVVADAGRLPFRAAVFTRVECDAVLEHVPRPEAAVREIERVLAPGGYAHLVAPFCHPFHEYPRDYWRFTPDGLKALAGNLEVVAAGWRTGPTATLLVFVLEYFKLLAPGRAWRGLVHGLLGWVLFPLRYLDLALLRSGRAGRLGNHCYLWLRKARG
jgi:SAM-dependent methyltransferase